MSIRQAPIGSQEADPRAIHTRQDLLRLLATRPDCATPALVRRLKERVEDLYRTDARASRELAEAVHLLAERCGDLESLALAHRARGLGALASGSRKEALRHYEEAERLYRLNGNDVERARVQRSMIDALMHLGRYDEAVAIGREAQEVFGRHGLTVLAAQVDANIGTVFERLDRNAESLEAYDRALQTFREAGEEEGVAMMEFNRANVFSNLSKLSAAERGYRRALRYYRAEGFRLREAQCLYALAYLLYLRSRYSASLRLFQHVKLLDEELGDLRHAALCDLDQAEVLLSLNAWREATGMAREAGESLIDLGMGFEAAKAMLFQGLGSVHLRYFGQAEHLLAEAEARFAREGNQVFRGLAYLYRAELELHRGNPKKAFDLAGEARVLFEGERLMAKEAYSRVLSARCLARLGRPAEARRQCHAALENLRRSPSASIAYQAHHLLGRLASSPRVAGRHLREALRLVERLRIHVVPDELRASFGRDKAEIHEDLAGHILAVGESRLSEAFGIVDLGKSRTLGDVLAQSTSGIRTAIRRFPRDLAAEWRRQLEELNGCYRRLNDTEVGDRPRSAGEALRREIDEREARLAKLRRTIQLGRSSRENSSVSGRRSLLRRVQSSLESDEALVEFFFLGQKLQAFVVLENGIQWVRDIAGRDEVQEALNRWRFQVGRTQLGGDRLANHRTAVARGLLDELDRLTRILWRPLTASLVSARSLIIVPAGPLFHVPFHALRPDGEFLVRQMATTTAASARGYLAALGMRSSRRNRPLIMGLERPELPAVRAEVAAVGRQLPGARVLLGSAARRSALRRFGRDAPVVHIASHAIFRGDNPLLSGIELADGRLTFYDLFDLRLGADLVVLSGCETGAYEVLEGDEVLGLARGFLYAGTASLVASLWPVDDLAVASFMESFYSCLERSGPRDALRQSMCALIDRGFSVHEWGAFFLSGKARLDRGEGRIP